MIDEMGNKNREIRDDRGEFGPVLTHCIVLAQTIEISIGVEGMQICYAQKREFCCDFICIVLLNFRY